MFKRLAYALVFTLLAFPAFAQNFPPQVPISMLPPGGPMQTSDLFPATRAGITYGVTWPPTSIPFSVFPSQTANIILGTIAIGPPAPLSIPGCNTTEAALTWTNNIGFGCHFIPTNTISSLLGATTTNDIDNAAFAQTWTWNSLTSGTALSFSSSSATSGTLFSAALTTSGNSGYAGYFQNTATGTTGYAVYAAGAENVTGALTALSLTATTISGVNASLSGTTTVTTAQIAAGNAALTNLTATTVTGNTGNFPTLNFTNALGSTITSTTDNTTTENIAGALQFTSTTSVPPNGVYLDSANSLSLSTSGTQIIQITPKVVAFKGALSSVTSGSGNCGTAPSLAGDDTTGRITVGSSTNGGVCTLVFASTKITAPVCVCDNETSVARGCSALSTSTTSSQLTASTIFSASDSIGYHCFGYQQ